MRVFATVCALLLCGAVGAGAQEPGRYFDDNCAPCHAIGGPPGAAPDLKDVTKRRDRAWLVRFIRDPEGLARTDADAAALIKRYDGTVMPAAEGVTAEFVEALLRYIDGTGAPAPSPALAERTPTAADLAAAREWYDGKRPLARRGPACVSCHRLESGGRLAGGSLGPDLTLAHQRLGGTAGITRWLNGPPTRVMRAVFGDRPLSGEETFALGALLGDAGARPPAAAGRPPIVFFAGGIAGALTVMLLMAMVWAHRLRSVRRAMVSAARRDEP